MTRPNTEGLPQKVLEAITQVVGHTSAALHEPSFGVNEVRYLTECISSTYVSYIGDYVKKFEKELQEFTGAQHIIPTTNGTSALHLALICGGVRANDEVLTPSLTFIATANAVTYCNAYPHLIDTDLNSLGVDIEKLHDYLREFTKQESGLCVNKKTGRVIRAIIPVHLFGHIAEMNDLLELARDYKIAVIEDAAEALGSFHKGKHAGTIGLLGALSFNGNKIITTGGGGALMTNDNKLAILARHLSTTAKLPHKWEFHHNLVGFNYRMPNLNAAVGCAQLEELPKKISQKRTLFKKYREAFALVNGVEVFQEPENSMSNYWLQTLILDESQRKWKDAILELTNLNLINTRPAWEPLHLQAPYADSESMNLENANSLKGRIINMPSSPKLADE